MIKTIELIHQAIGKRCQQVVAETKEREEAIRTMCKLQHSIEKTQYEIEQLHIELAKLKNMSNLAKLQASDNGCSLSSEKP